MKKLSKRLLKKASRFTERAEYSFFFPMVVLITLPLGIIFSIVACSVGEVRFGLTIMSVCAAVLAAASTTVISEKKYQKVEYEIKVSAALSALEKSESSVPHGEIALKIASTFTDIQNAHETGESAITNNEMTEAETILFWTSDALTSLKIQHDEIYRMQKYAKTSDEMKQLESLQNDYEELKVKLSEANDVLTGYYKDITKVRQRVLSANKAQAESALVSYPSASAEGLTYLRSAENQLPELKINV